MAVYNDIRLSLKQLKVFFSLKCPDLPAAATATAAVDMCH